MALTRRSPTSIVMPVGASAALTVLSAASPSPAQAAGGRQSMEQCVDRVLLRLVRARAPESQVSPTVLSACDGALRVTLAEAIQSGEAPFCTVESCLDMARSRAAQEATAEYRQRIRP
jgi:hypothetical protein